MALAVDSIGTGLFLPFAIIYFLRITSLSLTAIGTALTVARLVSLPVPILAGPLIDRFGARRLVIIADLLGACGFVGYLFVRSAWQIAVAAFVVSAGQAMFWTACRALIREVADVADRPAWFAMLGMTRNAGFGLGGLLAAAIVSISARWVFFLFAGLNAASFLVAAAILVSWKQPVTELPDRGTRSGSSVQASQPTGYLRLFRNPALVGVTLVNFAFVMCANVLNVLLVVYIVTTLKEHAWIGGLLFSVNTILVSTAQGVTTRRTSRFRNSTVLKLASACWAASFVILWLLSASPRWLIVPGLFLALVVFTLAEMLKEPTINMVLVGIAPDDAVGRYAAAFQLSWSVGSALAPAVLTGLLTAGVAEVWIVLLACCASAFIGAQFYLRTS